MARPHNRLLPGGDREGREGCANSAWLEAVIADADLACWAELICFVDVPALARCEITVPVLCQRQSRIPVTTFA